jgi:hypothetical protein
MLLIDNLSYDLQLYIYEMVLDLRKPKEVNKELLSEITNHKGLFLNIIDRTPLVDSTNYMIRYQHWSILLCRFIYILNDGHMISSGKINPYVFLLFDDLTREEICELDVITTHRVYDVDSLYKIIQLLLRCWYLMSVSKRMLVHSFTQ